MKDPQAAGGLQMFGCIRNELQILRMVDLQEDQVVLSA
jgi:hypothetical protein